MSDPNKDEPIDLDTLSDEDFMKLDPSDMQEVPDEEKAEVIIDADPDPNAEDPSKAAEENKASAEEDSSTSGSDADADADGEGTTPDPDGKDEGSDKDPDPATPGDDNFVPPVVDKPADKAKPDEKTVTPDPAAKPKDPVDPKEKKADPAEVKTPKTETADAVAFYEKVTASFKADGKDMKVRSPEDAIRLMQMGVNYSRRMEEMKPLRAQDQMLKANGLNSPDKINFMIDLIKGKPEAIKQLLIDHKIDPVDIDTSDVTPYKTTNYQGDPKDIAFDDAIQATVAAEGGRALIQDINKEWDDQSKEALRDQPSIFQNVLAQKQSGVYLKIKTELEYQRTMGFLADVPFLQAYHQVGEAMQKAGVFDTEKVQPGKATLKVAPLGTGTRKAVQKPKTEQPTPNVSSATPPRSTSSNDGGGQNEPDFSTMSDEDFMKMAPPG